MTTGFIKNTKILEEKVSDNVSIDISDSIKTLNEKINHLSGSNIIGIVGPFGIGKSTLIEQVKVGRDLKNEEWIHFDAWQFPDRKELWDGLILKTAEYQNKVGSIIKTIAGTNNEPIKTFIDSVAEIQIPGTPLVGMSLIKNLKSFVETSPATRVFQLQKIFTYLITSFKKENIIFVLEDIDRSGQDGLFFLETFKQFISTNELDKKITILVPISNKSYQGNLDTYLKCIDYVEFFNKKNDVKFEKFVEDFFKEDDEYSKNCLINFLEYIYIHYPDTTLRKIKLILRQANLNFIELERVGHKPNKIICVAISSSKYLNIQGEISYFEEFMDKKVITKDNPICRLIITTNMNYIRYINEYISDHEGKLQPTFDIKFTKKPTPEDTRFPSTPYNFEDHTGDSFKNIVGLPDFYFNNL